MTVIAHLFLDFIYSDMFSNISLYNNYITISHLPFSEVAVLFSHSKTQSLAGLLLEGNRVA